jgi:hypothetical protein
VGALHVPPLALLHHWHCSGRQPRAVVRWRARRLPRQQPKTSAVPAAGTRAVGCRQHRISSLNSTRSTLGVPGMLERDPHRRQARAPRDSAEGEKAAQGPQADQRRHWQQAEVTGGRQQGGGQGSANIFDRTSPFLALQTPSALGLRPGKRRRRANASTAPLSPLPPFSPRGGGVGGANSACPIPTA